MPMDQKSEIADSSSIIVYDGHCNLCNRSLQFVLNHDSGNRFVYIPFQSPQGRTICERFGIEFTESTSMLLLEDRQLYMRSRAWQKILGRLSLGYRLASFVIRVLPTSLCDRAYDFIGDRRYRWFGTSSSCRLVEQKPLPEMNTIEKRLPSNSK